MNLGQVQGFKARNFIWENSLPKERESDDRRSTRGDSDLTFQAACENGPRNASERDRRDARQHPKRGRHVHRARSNRASHARVGLFNSHL